MTVYYRRDAEEMPSTALDSPINYFRTKRLAELEVQRGSERGLDAAVVDEKEREAAFRAGCRAVLDASLAEPPVS